MKTIDVVAAIIVKDGQVLATQRGYGEFEGGWEFPGGKVEPGEAPEAAIVREIREELDAQIAVDDFLMQVEHDYPTFHLSMKCYLCSLESSFQLLEHHAAKWLGMADIDSVDWLPADIKVVDALKARFGE
jgi:8-oxo-dGTP diphosphatase